jgi:hypothetical protein
MKNKALFLLVPFILSIAPFASADITLTAGDFVQNTDGTVTHTTTGLIWQACSVGQTWDGINGTCTGTPKRYTSERIISALSDAMNYKSDFAGKTDWRIPNIVELNSLIDMKKSYPAINKSLFPQTPSGTIYGDTYLSTTLFVNSKDGLWTSYIPSLGDNFYYGYAYTGFYVRLVRGQELPTKLHLSDFKDNNDGSVTHSKTGLIWQRCSVGQTWKNGECQGVATFQPVDLKSNLGGNTDWRLPTYKELLTIVDYSQYGPATNLIAFPDTINGVFLTSTEKANDSKEVWVIDFTDGISKTIPKEFNQYVYPFARLVRGSTTTNTISTSTTNNGSVDLFITISGSPSPAIVNGNMTFTATLTNKGTLTATDAKLSFALPKNSISLVTKPTECSGYGQNGKSGWFDFRCDIVGSRKRYEHSR